MEELVAVLEHLVNRGDNPEIVIRQVSDRNQIFMLFVGQVNGLLE